VALLNEQVYSTNLVFHYSLDDWADVLNLPEPVPIAIDRNRLQYDQQHQVVLFPQIPDVMWEHKQIFRNQWRDDPYNRREYKHYIHDMGEQARERAGILYHYGPDFLFGMLFRNMFTIKVTVDNPFVNSQSEDTFSLALHSRHTVVGDDGSFLRDEIKCLQKLLPKDPSSETCVVYLMSDRPTTVRMLTEWLQKHNCTGVSVISPSDDHNALSLSHPIRIKNEHGPDPGGIGFIQDLDLSSNARSGLIGDTHRSSFMLLAELVAYDRRVDDWKRGKPQALPGKELRLHCKLPRRSGTGYNYGPGTPTFRVSDR
jgi:hypothetical protein